MYNCTVSIAYKSQNLGTATVSFAFSWLWMSLAGDLDLNIIAVRFVLAKDSMGNRTYDIAWNSEAVPLHTDVFPLFTLRFAN